MKTKVFNLAFVLLLALGLILTTGKANVFAAPIPIGTVPGTYDPVWIVTPTTAFVREIPMYEVGPSLLPNQQLMSKGLVISARAKICFDFRGGQFGWHGQIRMLSSGTWVPLATTVVWMPTIEGHLMACAQAPAAGTYALFAYWKPLP